jgi:hypothetical protein
MPGTRITEDQKRKFWHLTRDPKGPRLPIRAAAREVGMSPATAYRLSGEFTTSGTEVKKRRAERARELVIPKPLPLDELSTDARDALGDFNLFGEMFFALRPSHWRRDAAMRIVDALNDHTQRDYIDMNVFPGAGKTTLVKVVCCWLIAGGGSMDPAAGRGIRIMLGSETETVAKHMLRNVRLPLELERPFSMYDKANREWIQATHCLQLEYGRFKPDTSVGDEKLWSQEQILVATLDESDLVLKEPTVQVASYKSGFLGERVDLAVWDDLATTKNSRNPEIADALNQWCENEAETRVEKGGLFLLVGQRLSPLDLHRKRLDARVPGVDENDRETGELVPLYKHVIYPAHWDELCDGDHRQWVPEDDTGCLTDAAALPVRDWYNVRGKTDYQTVYQQGDADPARILVQQVWLEGGIDPVTREMHAGCYDRDRGFWEWPEKVRDLIDYVTIDPAAGNWWALEWWAVQPETRHNYLIEGRRGRIAAGQLLDWDNDRQEFTGWMHEVQVKSYELGHPIRVWVIETVAAFKFLYQYEHFRRWKQAFPNVFVITHETQKNKTDPEYGVEALMPTRYRTGAKHLPKSRGVEALNFLRQFEKELTTYPFAETYDTVMADWMGEWNLDKIISLGRQPLGEPLEIEKQQEALPGYLRRQVQEYSLQ